MTSRGGSPAPALVSRCPPIGRHAAEETACKPASEDALRDVTRPRYGSPNRATHVIDPRPETRRPVLPDPGARADRRLSYLEGSGSLQSTFGLAPM